MIREHEIDGVVYCAVATDTYSMSCKHCVAGRNGNRDLCDPLKGLNRSCGFNGEFVGDMYGKRIHWMTREGHALWRLTK